VLIRKRQQLHCTSEMASSSVHNPSITGLSTRTILHLVLYPIPCPISCKSDGDPILCPTQKSSVYTHDFATGSLSDSLSDFLQIGWRSDSLSDIKIERLHVRFCIRFSIRFPVQFPANRMEIRFSVRHKN
jgi:hypothetical protein